jgi:transcriptional regulator with XRE-family HTH domain
MRVAATLKHLLQERRISIRKLAHDTEISPSTIKEWLSGSAPRNLEDVRKVARYLNISFEFLIFGESDECPPEKALEAIFTESIYEGWLKVKIERAIPTKRKTP